jgi:hypothetical protein
VALSRPKPGDKESRVAVGKVESLRPSQDFKVFQETLSQSCELNYLLLDVFVVYYCL